MRIWQSLLASLLLGLLVAGCQSYPGTGSLWIGMSKSQALRAMGPPESVSAQGSFEYLNYTLAVNSGGIYAASRPYYVRLFDGAVESFGYGGQFSSATIPGTRPAGTLPGVGTTIPMKQDSIRVVSITPSTVTLDRPNRLKVKISYVLQSLPAGKISLSFNTKTPGMQLSLAGKEVPQGAGDVEIDVEILPVTWPNRSDVRMFASLFPASMADGVSSVAHAEWDLAVAK